MTARALVVQPDGHAELVQTETDLDSIKALIGGGWLEGVGGVYGRWTAYGDEEGRLKGFQLNPFATQIVAKGSGMVTDMLVGPVVFFGLAMGQPEDGYKETDVPPNIVRLAELLTVIAR